MVAMPSPRGGTQPKTAQPKPGGQKTAGPEGSSASSWDRAEWDSLASKVDLTPWEAEGPFVVEDEPGIDPEGPYYLPTEECVCSRETDLWAFDRDGRAERVQVELDRALARLLLGAVLDLCEEKGVEPTLELIVQHATRGGGLPFGLAGLLRAAHAQDVRSALRRMIALGFLRRENEGRLGLTFLGLDVLEGRLQHDAGMGLWRVAFPPAGDPELVERLRSYRTERAAALEVRPYRVLTDRQIHTVAHAKPRTLGTLAALPRVGPMTVATVGSDLIRLVTNYLEDFPARVPYGSGTDR